jgi:hypothetical protein
MGIARKSSENRLLTCRQIAMDIVQPNVAGVNQPLLVSLFDIADEFRGVKIGAAGDKRIPHLGVLPLQLAPEQTREVAQDLFAACLPGGYQRHKTLHSRAAGPFVGFVVLDYGLDPTRIATAHRSQDSGKIFRDEVAAEGIMEVAWKQRKPDHKRVSASLPELRQQKHGVQMGHVIGIELRRPVYGFLQDAEKFGCDLFPAHDGRFDGGSREFSGCAFELLQYFCDFHEGHRTDFTPHWRFTVLVKVR